MLIQEIKLNGFLSFGPESPSLPLRTLNVLIGPNGSGKSNLIEAISFMRAAPKSLAAALRGPSGGVSEWIWKGNKGGSAKIQVEIGIPARLPQLRHEIEFSASNNVFNLDHEFVREANYQPGNDLNPTYYQYPVPGGRGAILPLQGGSNRKLLEQDVRFGESILSQRREPFLYPELFELGEYYSKIKLYQEWTFGRSLIFRTPQPADMPTHPLEEDYSNLGLFLNSLRGVPRVKQRMVEQLRDLYSGLDDFDVRVKGGTVEVFLTEGDHVIPASRLSDGTLRYLCLLAILCDPEPPPLVCIEEPELGLHPDLIPKIADLLIEASERTQLVVTTHSGILVDAMTEQPESVVVFEKREGQTHARRLEAAELAEWLKDYRLGQLWTRGQIGGTRW